MLSALGGGVSLCIFHDVCVLFPLPGAGSVFGVSRPFDLGEEMGMVVTWLPLCAMCYAQYSGLTIHFILATSGKR